MGKTDSIKKRRVDVYLDTLNRKERWQEFAEAEGESLSSFVQKAVEFTIQQGGPDFGELGKSSQEIEALEEEIATLRDEIKQKDIVIEKLEDELKELRVQPFLAEEFEGRRRHDPALIEQLQAAERITADRLLQRMDVDPMDTDVIQGIDRQLRQLEEYGLVESTPQGWVWTG